MLRFLADENFRGAIVRGLILRQPTLDLVRIQDVSGLPGTPDPGVLAWAADRGRILLTHDFATVPHDAYARVAAGQPMPGVFAIPDRLPIGSAIEELLTLAEDSDHEEWRDCVWFLPILG